ncbi:MAG: flagellar hook-associated protein FlgL [Candidatus Omnitrophica bacterium]|nr:flagellar hook-associated protein FlgL [Candidatus Omnitrophota bacterium]
MVRITQSLLSSQSLFYLQNNIQRLSNIQNILSTGKQINEPSDDPSAYSSALSLRTSILQGQSYQSNLESARSMLEMTESTLNTVTETLQTIREMAVQGASDIGADARTSLAIEVRELYDYILDLANTTYNGQNLFGGSCTQGQAFSVQGGVVIYNGDDDQRQVLIGNASKITTNITGADAFLHTTNQITGAVSLKDASAPLSEQLNLVNSGFPNTPSIPDKPASSRIDPSPNPANNPNDKSNRYATFQIYNTEIRVDLSVDSLEDVVNRINAVVPAVEASINDQNRLVISSNRSESLQLQDGARSIGFEGDPPSGVNLLSALGMNQRIESTRLFNQGYPASNPLIDSAADPAPARSAVQVEANSFLFAGANTGPDHSPDSSFGDNLALTNVDENGNDAYLINGNPDFINQMEALRITIDDEVIDVDLRALTQGYDFDGIQGNEDDVAGSTIDDLLDLINNHPQLDGRITAYINAAGSGIELSAAGSVDNFQVENVRCLFGRDITRQVEIDPVTGQASVVDAGEITLNTRLDDLPGALVDEDRGSRGIRRTLASAAENENYLNWGLISISNDGKTAAVDLSKAETIGDVINAVNDSKVGVKAKINASGTGIDIVSITGGGKLSVVDLYDSTTARDLGLFQNSKSARIASHGGIDETDAIASAFPPAVSGSFEIEVRDAAGALLEVYTIDVDASVPGGDTLKSLARKIDEADGRSGSSAGLISAYIQDGALNIVSNYNEHTLSIDPANDTTGTDASSRITNLLGINQYTFTSEAETENYPPYTSAQNTASILGINQQGSVNEIQGSNLFNTIQTLELALREDDDEGISQALKNIDADLEAILNSRTALGIRLNRLDSAQNDLINREGFLQDGLSNIEDADLAEAITKYTEAENAYSAALQVSSRVLQKSLLDYLS